MSAYPPTIPDLLTQRAASANGIVFLDADGERERWTYGDLAEIAGRAAGAWRSLGVREGDRVGILGSTSPDLVAAIFGAWAAGAVAVPLAVPLRLSSVDALAEEIRSRAAKAGVALLAADPLLAAVPEVMGVVDRTVTLDDLRARGTDAALASPDPDAPALIQFTSGSTARPKGVVLSHRTLLANGVAASERTGLGPGDVAVSWLPLYHDFGLIGLTLWPVLLDMPTHLIPPEVFIGSPKRWVAALSRYAGTVTAAPNFAYGLAARAIRTMDGPLDLSPLRIAANGAEPIDHETMQDFAAAASEVGFRPEALIGVYGLAEATLGVAAPAPLDPPPVRWVDAQTLAAEGIAVEAAPGAAGARPLVSVGRPIQGVEVEIRSPESDETLPDGHVGEICLRTEFAMLGYWDDPEETGRVLRDGWLRTGDLGLVGPDGLVITGRLKDMIIVGGRNLYPEDAERAAQRVPGVRRGNAVAFGILGRAREGLVVIAETKLVGEEAARLAKQIASEVRKALRVAAEHVVLLAPGTLPKTPSGKLQRRLTAALYEAGQLLSDAVATAGRTLRPGTA